MGSHFNPNKRPAEDAVIFGIAVLLAVSLICLVTWAFCWSFFIPFHFRYLIGVTLTALMVKWMFFNRK